MWLATYMYFVFARKNVFIRQFLALVKFDLLCCPMIHQSVIVLCMFSLCLRCTAEVKGVVTFYEK